MIMRCYLLSRYRFLLFVIVVSLLFTKPLAGAEPFFDVLYLKSKKLSEVLDYRESLAAVFDQKIMNRIRVMGAKNEYALVLDNNVSKESLAKTLVVHGTMLQKAGLPEPLGVKGDFYAPLYNISYGIGPNLLPLQKRYTQLYRLLGNKADGNLVIEKTSRGNYVLVLHLRARWSEAADVVRSHVRMLRRLPFSASLTPENGNEIVYGESSHIDAVESTDPKSPADTLATSSEGKKILHPKKRIKYHRQIETGLIAQVRFDRKSESALEKAVEVYINGLRRKGKIRGDEATGWMVYDLAKDRSVVDINANRRFQAASMIKPFVALAFFHRVQEGKLNYGPKSRRKMILMIQRSNNNATNWVMKQVGGAAACDAVLREVYPDIFRNTRICELIPKGGRTYRNAASPGDYVRFLKALWENSLPYSREIRRLMALPGRDRIYDGTPIPRGTLVYNKTGSTAHLIGDMGILVPQTRNGKRYPYIIVGIIESSSRAANYSSWMNSRANVIRKVSTLVYKKLKKQHRFI